MLRNKITSAVLLAGVLAGGLIASQARATQIYTNTATGTYKNEANQAMAAVIGTADFTGQSNPVLTVVKTGDKAAGPAGTVVTWSIRVAYPKIADTAAVCGDDSKATSVVISDPIPDGFTYVPGSITFSVDNGVTPVVGTDAVGGDSLGFDVSFNPAGNGTVTANTPDLVEGQGDAACTGVTTALVVTFQTTKN